MVAPALAGLAGWFCSGIDNGDDLGTKAVQKLSAGDRTTLVFDCIVVQSGDRLVFAADVFKHQGGNAHQMGDVGDRAHFASLVAVQAEGEGKGIDQTIAEDYRATGEGAGDARGDKKFFSKDILNGLLAQIPGQQNFDVGLPGSQALAHIGVVLAVWGLVVGVVGRSLSPKSQQAGLGGLADLLANQRADLVVGHNAKGAVAQGVISSPLNRPHYESMLGGGWSPTILRVIGRT